jgi:hypothetical protein
MGVLVTTIDGYHIFTSSGKHLTSLEGHQIHGFTPGPDGTWLAIVDSNEIWSHGRDGDWTPIATSTRSLTAVVAAGDAIFAGTDDARVLRRNVAGALEPVPAFDTIAGRDSWHAVGMPLRVRSMTATAGDTAMLVNVHVGGIPRSVDGGTTWAPTIAVDDDVHQVLAHPSRAEIVVAAATVGLCRSVDGGASWDATTTGMQLSYARAVTFVGDDVLVTGSEGPFSTRAAVYRASVDGGPVEQVTGGLPEFLAGNIDTGCIGSDGSSVALVDGDGDVWRSTDGYEGFTCIARGLAGVTGVAVA